MNENKKAYESPRAEKMEFDFSEHVVASTVPGHPKPGDLDEDGNPIIDSDRIVYTAGSCYYYNTTDCYD